MLIGGKSGLTESQVRNRIELGFQDLEIAVFWENLADTRKSAATLRSMPINYYSFHTPHSTDRYNKTGLGIYSDEKRKHMLECFKRCMELAQLVQQDTQLVVHVGEELSFDNNEIAHPRNLTYSELFLEEVSKLREYAPRNHPGLVITLEHVPPVQILPSGFLYREWGSDWRYMKLVQDAGFNDIVKATIDFPHMSYYVEFMRRRGHSYDFQNYFDAFGEDLSLVHFANPRGARKEYVSTLRHHSRGFDSKDVEDRAELARIAALLRRNSYDGPITVEIQLKDYEDGYEIMLNAKLLEEALRATVESDTSKPAPISGAE